MWLLGSRREEKRYIPESDIISQIQRQMETKTSHHLVGNGVYQSANNPRRFLETKVMAFAVMNCSGGEWVACRLAFACTDPVAYFMSVQASCVN